jgi:hypothetical protein
MAQMAAYGGLYDDPLAISGFIFVPPSEGGSIIPISGTGGGGIGGTAQINLPGELGQVTIYGGSTQGTTPVYYPGGATVSGVQSGMSLGLLLLLVVGAIILLR